MDGCGFRGSYAIREAAVVSFPESQIGNVGDIELLSVWLFELHDLIPWFNERVRTLTVYPQVKYIRLKDF